MIKMICRIVFVASVLIQSIFSQTLSDSTSPKINIPPSSKQTLYGRITDVHGKPVIAQIQAWYYPLKEVVFAFGKDTVKGRTDNLICMAYSENNGYYAIKVPVDTITLIITKGPEWSIAEERFVIRKNEFEGIEYNVTLKKLYDLSKQGWYSGDAHHHSLHSDGRQTPSRVAHAMKGVGLSWGILSDHNSVAGNKEWIANTTENFIAIPGCEITTEPSRNSELNGYGHLNQSFINEMNTTYPDNPNIWARAIFSNHKDVQTVIDGTHEQKGFISINHPYQSWDWSGRYKSWGEVKYFDAIEVWNGDPPHSLSTNTWAKEPFNINTWALHSWFSYLDEGNKISGIAGSDCHDIYGAGSYPKGEFYWTTTTGNPRTYIYCKKLSEKNIQDALEDGKIFLTSGFGPLLLISSEGKTPGEIINVPENGVVEIKIEVLANRPLKKMQNGVRVIINGEALYCFDTDSVFTFARVQPVKIEKDSWVIVEAFGQWPMYAVTNPIYLDYPPYGNFPSREWKNPAGSREWNIYLSHPQITIPDGVSNWKEKIDKTKNK